MVAEELCTGPWCLIGEWEGTTELISRQRGSLGRRTHNSN